MKVAVYMDHKWKILDIDDQGQGLSNISSFTAIQKLVFHKKIIENGYGDDFYSSFTTMSLFFPEQSLFC